MNNVHEREMRIVPSGCERNAELRLSSLMDIFMDSAMLHAEEIKVGITEFWPRKLFWVATKQKIRFNRPVKLSEAVIVRTWPEEPGNFKSIRYYEMLAGNEQVAFGKTEWVVVNTDQFKPMKVKEVFPELDFCDRKVMEENFERIKDEGFNENAGSYRVRRVDIDYGKHMNNVAYIRAIEGLFTTKEWEEQNFMEIEIQYKESVYEGDEIVFMKKWEEDRLIIKGMKKESEPVVYAILKK